MNFHSMPERPRRPKLLIVFGTRPEALKCFPVAMAAIESRYLDTEICVTAQHREMVDSVIALTGMPVDYDLNVMSQGQTLFDVTAKVLQGMEAVLEKSQPDIVMVQGDTTTAMTAALAAFYKRIPVAHIEAVTGKFTMKIRVTDGQGAVMIEDEQAPLPDGATGWPTRTVEVGDDS